MFALISAFAARAGFKLWLGLAIVLAIGAALLGARRAGRMAAKVEALEQTARAARVRTQIEIETKGDTDDALDDRLRPPSRRRRR